MASSCEESAPNTTTEARSGSSGASEAVKAYEETLELPKDSKPSTSSYVEDLPLPAQYTVNEAAYVEDLAMPVQEKAYEVDLSAPVRPEPNANSEPKTSPSVVAYLTFDNEETNDHSAPSSPPESAPSLASYSSYGHTIGNGSLRLSEVDDSPYVATFGLGVDGMTAYTVEGATETPLPEEGEDAYVRAYYSYQERTLDAYTVYSSMNFNSDDEENSEKVDNGGQGDTLSSYGSLSDSGAYSGVVGSSPSLRRSDDVNAGLPPLTSQATDLDSYAFALHCPPVDLNDPKYKWTVGFRKIVAMRDSYEKFAALSRLAREFVYVAETFGRVIISEIGVQASEKTIKPIDVGGVAGGTKFIVQGVLFKFADDDHGIYGGDENAQKATGHDMKGLMAYYMAGVPGLNFPFMTIINYLGFCLIAVSLLPISKHTLKYGSYDGGRTVFADHPLLNKKMELVGERLNLMPHLAGMDASTAKVLAAPGDIEGHHGFDGRFYVLDFARTFPPEARLQGDPLERGAMLYKLLRPELVKSHPVKLNPDSFTLWTSKDANRIEHAAELKRATLHLRSVIIPELAELIVTQSGVNSNNTTSYYWNSRAIGILMHSKGVNLRYLGALRAAIRSLDYSEKADLGVLIEIVARSVKSVIRHKWRESIKEQHYATEEMCKETTTQVLNLVCQNNSKSHRFWNDLKKVIDTKYRWALTEEERGEGFDLRVAFAGPIAIKSELFHRILTRCSIVFNKDALSSLEKKDDNDEGDFLFIPSDITEIKSATKSMHIIDVADAQAMLYAGLASDGDTMNRLFQQALRTLENSKHVHSFESDIMLSCGKLLADKYHESQSEAARHLATECFDVAFKANSKKTKALLLAAALNRTDAEKFTELLGKAIEADPECKRAYLEIAFGRSFLDSDRHLDKLKAVVERFPEYPRARVVYAAALLLQLSKRPVSEDELQTIISEAKELLDVVQGEKERLARLLNIPQCLSLPSKHFNQLLRAYITIGSSNITVAKELNHSMLSLTLPRKFNISNQPITDELLLFAVPILVNVKELNVSGCRFLSPAIICGILDSAKDAITEANLSNTLSDESVLETLTRCSALTALSLGSPTNIPTTKLSTFIATHAGNLVSLDLSGTEVDDAVLRLTLPALSHLLRLALNSCHAVTGAVADYLPQLAPDLTHVLLQDNPSLSLDHAKAIVSGHASLIAFDLNRTIISDLDVFAWATTLSHKTLLRLVSPSGFTHYFSGQHRFAISSAISNDSQVKFAKFHKSDSGDDHLYSIALHGNVSSIGPATTTLEVNLAQVPVQVRISPSTASKVAYITYNGANVGQASINNLGFFVGNLCGYRVNTNTRLSGVFTLLNFSTCSLNMHGGAMRNLAVNPGENILTAYLVVAVYLALKR